jgi:hypothetical protein
VEPKDVQRLLYRGELPGVQLAASRIGRSKNLSWSLWYVKRSDAIKARFFKGSGRNENLGFNPSPRALAWIRQAWEQGMNYAEITRTMGSKVTSWTLRQFMVKNGMEKRRSDS